MNSAGEGERKKTKKERKRLESEREQKHINLTDPFVGLGHEDPGEHMEIPMHSRQNKIGMSAGDSN
jgi:hypothetical protein